MLKIWGRITSVNVRKVVLAAQWMNVPFERVDAGLAFGIVNTPEYLARNPNGRVPLIEDDELRLWESNVIVRYLCAKHAFGTLYPEPLAQRFDAERWMDWQQTTFNPAARDAFQQLFRTAPEQRSEQVVARSIARTEPLLGMLDAHLAGQAFMAGDRATMADFPIACELHRWRGLPIAHTPHPRLDRWNQGIAAHPAAHGVFDVALS